MNAIEKTYKKSLNRPADGGDYLRMYVFSVAHRWQGIFIEANMKTLVATLMLSVLLSAQTSKYAYVSSFLFAGYHSSVTDCRLYKGDVKLPKFYESDEFYLGGTAVVFIAIPLSGYSYAKEATTWQFIKTTIAGLIGASLTWDLNYGSLRHNDAFYPFENWYNHNGFKNKTQRITFDFLRLGLIVLLLIE